MSIRNVFDWPLLITIHFVNATVLYTIITVTLACQSIGHIRLL